LRGDQARRKKKNERPWGGMEKKKTKKNQIDGRTLWGGGGGGGVCEAASAKRVTVDKNEGSPTKNRPGGYGKKEKKPQS